MEISEELEAKVLRQYHKGYTADSMGNLGICPKHKAVAILKKHGLVLKRGRQMRKSYGG